MHDGTTKSQAPSEVSPADLDHDTLKTSRAPHACTEDVLTKTPTGQRHENQPSSPCRKAIKLSPFIRFSCHASLKRCLCLVCSHAHTHTHTHKHLGAIQQPMGGCFDSSGEGRLVKTHLTWYRSDLQFYAFIDLFPGFLS